MHCLKAIALVTALASPASLLAAQDTSLPAPDPGHKAMNYLVVTGWPQDVKPTAPARFEVVEIEQRPFLTGFLQSRADGLVNGRPVSIPTNALGELIVTDDAGGRIGLVRAKP